ncbi:MAG: hypothetical protein V3U75_03980 [Methylococcaceae bacterium]
MKKQRLSLLLIAVLLPTPLMATNVFGEMMATMMRTMLIMANSMAMSSSTGGNIGPGGSMTSYYPTVQNINPYSNWYSYSDSNPWAAPQGDYYGGPPTRLQPKTALEGQWVSRSGDVLEVRGRLFRLRRGQKIITGQFQLTHNIVEMIPNTRLKPMRYMFSRRNNFLILHAQTGNALQFRQTNASQPKYLH